MDPAKGGEHDVTMAARFSDDGWRWGGIDHVHGLRELVLAAGLDARWSDEIPGTVRCHVDDPFGNRIELIEVAPS